MDRGPTLYPVSHLIWLDLYCFNAIVYGFCSCHFSVHYQVYKVDWAQMLTLIAECIKNPKKTTSKG